MQNDAACILWSVYTVPMCLVCNATRRQLQVVVETRDMHRWRKPPRLHAGGVCTTLL